MKIKLSSINLPEGGYSKVNILRRNNSLEGLKKSLQSIGMVQPVLVKKTSSQESTLHYELVTGYRRYQAALELGWSSLPARIIDPDTELETLNISLEDNLTHRAYTPLEEIELILLKYRFWSQNSTHDSVLPVVPKPFCIETGVLLGKPAEEIRGILSLSGLDLDLKGKILSGDHRFCEAWAIQAERNKCSSRKKRSEPRKQLFLQLLDIQQKAPFLTHILSTKLWLQSNAQSEVNLSQLQASTLRRLKNDTRALIGYLSQWVIKFDKALR